jgi:site-specific recombinase XerD
VNHVEVDVALAVVRDIRAGRAAATAEDVASFETDALAGYVLARASAEVTDTSIQREVGCLEQIRTWFGRPLWEMEPTDADAYFGKVLRSAAPATRQLKAFALATYFRYLEIRLKAEIYQLTGRVVECPLDELNTPRGRHDMALRIPPEEIHIIALFTGWRGDLVSCRKFATAARNYVAARLMAQVGLRINEARMLDLDDVRWELGRFGKLHVRHGKGARGSGPRERMVPLINGGDMLLRWFIEEVWGLFDLDDTRAGAPLFPSERKGGDGSSLRIGDHALRLGLAETAARHMPGWDHKMTPHVLRHYCASQLYLDGMDLLAIQELLGHEWLTTTMRYVHVHRGYIEESWLAGQQRAATRLSGLLQ